MESAPVAGHNNLLSEEEVLELQDVAEWFTQWSAHHEARAIARIVGEVNIDFRTPKKKN